MQLKRSERISYLNKVAEAFSKFENTTKEVSWIEQLNFVQSAHALDSKYRCVGGGVPVPASFENCGVSEYAGFKCEGADAGKEICNPLVFGVRQDGSPACYENATTKKCYKNLVTGKNTFFNDEKFETQEVKDAYKSFKEAIDAICTGEVEVEEPLRFRNEACGLLRRQTELNKARASRGSLEMPDFMSDSDSVVKTLAGNSGSELADSRSAALPSTRYGLHSQAAAQAFTSRCIRASIPRKLCDEMTRPNDHSKSTFRRVYPGQPHILMPPANKWDEGIEILKIASDDAASDPNIEICQIANWYRPHPYNGAVGGARRSQHLNGEAIDIHYCSRRARNAALRKLQQRRSSDRRIGIGTYKTEGSVTIHLNIRSRSYHI
jgi:hypothetical protein